MAKKKSKKKPHKMHAKKGAKYHSNLGGAHKKAKRKKASKKRASKKSSVAKHYHSGASSYARGIGEFLTAEKIKQRAKRRGKRWVCGGPVRSGCGGSNSRVVK